MLTQAELETLRLRINRDTVSQSDMLTLLNAYTDLVAYSLESYKLWATIAKTSSSWAKTASDMANKFRYGTADPKVVAAAEKYLKTGNVIAEALHAQGK